MNDVFPDYPDVVLAIVVVDCENPMRLATFWSELLGRKIVMPNETWVSLEWSPRFGAGMSFQRSTDPRPSKSQLHVDVICSDIPETAKRVLALGGAHAEGYGDDDRKSVMLDPEGNVFWLIRTPGA
jgi:predicted enzyme related to lactoylglutathione lyase